MRKLPPQQFRCSSTEVVNALIYEISRTIEVDGLKTLRFRHFADENVLESWPLSCLVEKATRLEKLEITHLETTEENKQVMLEMVQQLLYTSSTLKELKLDGHGMTPEDGELLL